MALSKKKIVVIGGGIGGALAAYNLQKVGDVTLIDEKDYVEVRWAIPRMIVDPKVADKALIKHSEYLKTGTVVTSTASHVTKDTVDTVDGGHYPFDYLVLSTGLIHSKNGPAPYHEARTKEEQRALYDADRKALEAATSILVVGGGPVGVEVVGELITEFPGKKVTVVHSDARIANVLREDTSAKLLTWLQGKGVEVLLGDRVDVDGAGVGGGIKTYTTKNGVQIQADYVIMSVGSKPATAGIKEGLFSDAVDEHGAFRVGPDLRVLGFENIFAIGDCAGTGALPQGVFAGEHANLTAANISALIKAKPDVPAPTLKAWKVIPADDTPMAVSLGRNDGVVQAPGGKMLTGFIVAAVKSRDMFVSKFRGDLGLYGALSSLGFGISLLKGLAPPLAPYLG